MDQPPSTPGKKAKRSQKYVSSSLTNLKTKDKKSLQSASVSFADGEGARFDSSMESGGTGKAYLMKNYFGLPIYAIQQSPLAIVYQSRGAIVASVSEKSIVQTIQHENEDTHVGRVDNTAVSSANQVAQRKVAASLLSMAHTESMTNYFLHKGGIEAVARLIYESGDSDVLFICSTALHQASTKEDNCKVLIAKQIVAPILKLIEAGDHQIRLHCAKTMVNLSLVPGISEEQLVVANALSVVQSMLNTSASNNEIMCLATLCLSNISPSLAGNNDVEVAVRTCLQVSKRLDVMKNLTGALFLMRVFANLSCLSSFSNIMCEESIVPLMLHLIEAHPHPDIIGYASETFLNLSMVRKNRREIASSGLAQQLGRIFTIGDANARARALTTIGNLLNSNQFFDKMANNDLLDTILNVLFVLDQPKQFCAVAYCLSQLATNKVCAEILVNCDVVKKTVEFLVEAPPEATNYMWNVLVSLSIQGKSFFNHIIREKAQLLPAFISEAQKLNDIRVEPIALLAYNLSLSSDLSEHLDISQTEMLVRTLKYVMEIHYPLKLMMLTALESIASSIPASRPYIMQDDIIKLLSSGGDGGAAMNIKCAALLNLISCDEKCCQPLLESGAQQFLVTIHACMMTAYAQATSKESRSSPSRMERLNTANTAEGDQMSSSMSVSAMSSLLPNSAVTSDMIELGQDLIASTLHNLSLKRPVLGAGVLALLLALMKNTKNERVLYCVRTMANISTQSKAKHILAKERKLIPFLTAIMRFGCKFAEKVQQYCAIIICNVLATKVDKATMEEIINNGTIVDLVVVTLLRVNRVNGDKTKESLARALFNLMSATDFREMMVTNLDVFSATLDLARIESMDLLEICVRSAYNISCQFPNSGNAYSKITKKFSALKVPALMIARATSSPSVPGCKSSAAIKFLCGMTLANMSFIPELAVDLTEEKVSNAAFTVMGLDSDEATYCVAVLLYNLSQHRNCVTMADMQAVPLLTSIVSRGPLVCSQLAMSALCNLSMLEAFYHQLTTSALQAVVAAMGSPQTEMSIRMDAKRCVYNLVTKYPACRVQAVMSDCSSALMALAKSQSDDAVLVSIGRIVKDLCSEANDETIHRKLLQDNIMPLLLKLSKLEIPELKYDISCAIFSMTMVPDTMRVLKWDSVDILFWLTLHDCLSLQDNILRNVGRALRNFTVVSSESKYIVKEDRFMGVLKVLSKSTNEDVLWQCAGICYNILHSVDCRKAFLARGAMTLIFELAATNFTSVRHVCSACVHMVPEAMPDMEDPLVLQLILCLLDADGEKHAELGERCLIPLPYDVPIALEKSPFVHIETNFKPTWVTLTTTTDNLFTPVAYPPQPSTLRGIENLKPFDTNSICSGGGFTKLTAHDFNNFAEETVTAAVEDGNQEEDDEDDDDALESSRRTTAELSSKAPAPELARQPSKRNRRPSSKALRSPTRAKSPILEDTKKLSSMKGFGAKESQVTLPKLSDAKKMPDDTLSAIKSSMSSSNGKPSKTTLQKTNTLFTVPKLK